MYSCVASVYHVTIDQVISDMGVEEMLTYDSKRRSTHCREFLFSTYADPLTSVELRIMAMSSDTF